MTGILAIEEIVSRFREEYVLLDHCRFDDGCQPTHGRIVRTSADRAEVYDALREIPNSIVIYAGQDSIDAEAFLDEGRARLA